MTDIVHVENLVKRYDDLIALDHFNLSIAPGEIFGLLGPNGSGKTTSINCILQLLAYDKGTIELFGEPMTPTRYDLKRRIGVVPQQVAVFDELTVRENIDYFCGLYVNDRKRRRALVDEAIDFVGLGDFAKFRPGKLSGGLARRLNIACGIALFALAAPMAQDVIGMEPGAAAAMVGLIGLFNGGGRFIWSTVSDYIGRGRMYALFFLMEVIAFWQLGNTRDAFLFQAMIFLITSCSGGGFSVMPAYLTDLFGTRLLGAVHGRMLTAWAAAGIVGPMLVSWLRAQTGGYTVPLLFFAGCFVLNFIIALVLQRFGITSAAARFHAAA